MKSTGIIRSVDNLGRIVLPMELRKSLDIKPVDLIEIWTDNSDIVLHKHQAGCIFCGEAAEIIYAGKCVCKNCIEEMKKS